MAIKRIACSMFCLMIACAAQAERIGIAAIVNDDVISTTDVDERRSLIMASSNIPDTAENQQKITPRIVQSLIDEALELQEAKRQSLAVTDEEVAKAIDELAANRSQKSGGLKQFIAENHLSQRSLESQIRAQLAWQKVVQRKLRRNVTISQDEIQRAQQAQAAAPGTTELRIAALSIPVPDPSQEAQATRIAQATQAELKSGASLMDVAAKYMGQNVVQFNPPTWVPEEGLQPAMQQAMRGMQPGDVSPPLRSQNSIQFIQLIDRQVTKKQSDNTEVALKQIGIAVPPKPDKKFIARVRETTNILRSNPGNCMDENLPMTPVPAQVRFARTRLGQLTPDQRAVVSKLEVGGISDPLMAPDMVRVVMLCEKIEPAAGNLPDADTVRQQLFSEKIELEAQKHLRNLRRDAFIDIKDAP